MRLNARSVRQVFRRPFVFWVAAASLTLLTAAFIWQLTAEASRRSAMLGERVTVAIASDDLAAGHVIGADDVRMSELPAIAVPPDAASPEVVGAVVTAPVFEGEIVSARRLGTAGLGAVAAMVPAGHRAVAVALDFVRLPLEIGDRVDLLASTDAFGGPVHLVSAAALVIAVNDDGFTAAVPLHEVDAVAEALQAGAVTPALAGVP